MKTYTTIPNIIASKLSSADTYRFTCLSFTPRKDGYTDSTFKQIGALNSNKPESENTIKDFVERLKTTDLLEIDEVYLKGKRRNKFFIYNHKSNFRMISNSILDAELPVVLKGFLIQLFTLTFNNTYEINFSVTKICSLIKISRPTAGKYLKELEKLQLVFRTETGFLLADTYFQLGNTPKLKQIEQIYLSIQGCDSLMHRFNKTDWSAIKNPVDYWRSVEGGVAGKKEETKLEVELIIL